MTNNTIQQKQLLRYEIVAIDKVEQRLNVGYKLHGSPVHNAVTGKLCQAVIMFEPLALQRLSYKKRRVYAMHRQGVKRGDIAKQLNLEPRTVTDYLALIKRLINE